jgi:hypothetical protein
VYWPIGKTGWVSMKGTNVKTFLRTRGSPGRRWKVESKNSTFVVSRLNGF